MRNTCVKLARLTSASLCWLGLCLLAAGCPASGPSGEPFGGTVNVDGKPARLGMVLVTTVKAESETSGPGMTVKIPLKDGKFSGGSDLGLAPGQYALTFELYLSETSEEATYLEGEHTLPAGGTKDAVFELVSKPARRNR